MELQQITSVSMTGPLKYGSTLLRTVLNSWKVNKPNAHCRGSGYPAVLVTMVTSSVYVYDYVSACGGLYRLTHPSMIGVLQAVQSAYSHYLVETIIIGLVGNVFPASSMPSVTMTMKIVL